MSLFFLSKVLIISSVITKFVFIASGVKFCSDFIASKFQTLFYSNREQSKGSEIK